MAKLRDQTVNAAGRIVLGAGMLVASGVIGGGLVLNQLSDAGNLQPGRVTVVEEHIIAAVTETGSTSATEKYDAACFANPLSLMSPDLGSGTVVRAYVSNSANPAGVSGDLGFVKACNSKTASGQTLINNTCTGTGCVSYYTTGTAAWNGADFIKLTFSGDPTSSYSGRVYLEYEDYYGE